jgi:hypothetical protein
MTAETATQNYNAPDGVGSDAEFVWPTRFEPVSAQAAVEAVRRNKLDVIERYLFESERLNDAVVNALRDVYGEDRLRRILAAYGPKPLNASAYHQHWKGTAGNIHADYGLRLNRHTIPTLAGLGLGPTSAAGYEVGRWARAKFFNGPHLPWSPKQFWPRSGTSGAKWQKKEIRALVIGQWGQNPNQSWVVDQLNAFGIDVIGPKDSASSAINAAAQEDYQLAHVAMEHCNLETIVAVTDWFHERELPYILRADHRALPLSIASSAIVLDDAGPEDFRTAVKRCIAPHDRDSLTLDARLVRWDGEELDPWHLLSLERDPCEPTPEDAAIAGEHTA